MDDLNTVVGPCIIKALTLQNPLNLNITYQDNTIYNISFNINDISINYRDSSSILPLKLKEFTSLANLEYQLPIG